MDEKVKVTDHYGYITVRCLWRHFFGIYNLGDDKERFIVSFSDRNDAEQECRQLEKLNYGCENMDAVCLEPKQATSNKNKQWISVSERLPNRGQEVIVYTGNAPKQGVHDCIFWHEDFHNWLGVTHWMPLPQPPKGE